MRCGIQGCWGAEKHTSVIFYLIFEIFKRVRSTVHIFQFIFHLIFDGLCIQKGMKNKSKMDQKREPWVPLMLWTFQILFTLYQLRKLLERQSKVLGLDLNRFHAFLHTKDFEYNQNASEKKTVTTFWLVVLGNVSYIKLQH